MSTMKCIGWFCAAALVAAGCGSDDGGPAGPDAGGTAQPDAEAGDTDAGDEPEDTAIVVALGASEDVGVVSTIGIPSLDVTQDVAQGTADSDAVVRRIGENLYILNRALDNLTILDGGLELVDQFSLGSGANPQDVAAVGDTIYVAALGAEGVLVLDATDPGAGVVDTIDLSALDPDDVPNCNALHLAGDVLLAACQRLDDEDANLPPRGAGAVAVIDTSDDSVIDDFELARENPFSRIVATPEDGPLGGDLLLSSVGNFTPAGGCIERVSLDPEPASEGCFLDGQDLGGYVTRMDIDGETLWIVGSRADFSSFVAAYDLGAGELSDPLTAESQTPTDLAICPEGEIVVADNEFGGARGLRVFSDGEELTNDLLDIGANPGFSQGLVCY